MTRTPTMKPSLLLAPASPAAPSPLRVVRRCRRGLGAWAAALVVLFALCMDSRPAAAFDAPLLPGQEAAFAVDAALGVGSLISIAGNAADIARGRPQRGWMYSGFVLGWINTVIAPLLMVYGRDPDPALGLGLGAAHLAIGVTNLGLAIRNAVVWHRLRVAESAAQQPPPPAAPAVSVAPLLGRDRFGGTVYGLSLQVAQF